MGIKDCFSKRWISYELSRSCMTRYAIGAVEEAYALRIPSHGSEKIILNKLDWKYSAKDFLPMPPV